ncbi:MAG: HAMP domain-containing protein [Bacteroidales bacterium]|nr:HAMP domain-containing protein [Bacteroidales bacterium]
MKSITGNLVNMLKSNQYDEAEVVYFSEYIPVFDTMREAMNQYTDLFLAETDTNYIQAQKTGKGIYVSTSIGFLLLITILIFSAYLLTISITVPLKNVITAAEEIAGGNLHVKIEAEGNNETTQVLKAVEK